MGFGHLLLILENLSQHYQCGEVVRVFLNCVANVLFGLRQFFPFESTASFLVVASRLRRNPQPYRAHSRAPRVGKFPRKAHFIFDYHWLWKRLYRWDIHPGGVGLPPGLYGSPAGIAARCRPGRCPRSSRSAPARRWGALLRAEWQCTQRDGSGGNRGWAGGTSGSGTPN